MLESENQVVETKISETTKINFSDFDLAIISPIPTTIPFELKNADIKKMGISLAYDLNPKLLNDAQIEQIRSYINDFQLIIVDCKYTQDQLINIFVYTNQIEKIVYGCDFYEYSEIVIPETHELSIVVTRNWTQIHANETILKSMSLLKSNSLDFTGIFYGEGPEKSSLQEKYEHLTQDNKVKFEGFADTEILIDTFAKNHVYVSAASSDGTSVSLLEAMSAGLACVVTDFPSNREIIKHGENGFIFPVGNAIALFDLLTHISQMEHSELLRIRRNARATASTIGNWKVNAANLLEKTRTTK